MGFLSINNHNNLTYDLWYNCHIKNSMILVIQDVSKMSVCRYLITDFNYYLNARLLFLENHLSLPISEIYIVDTCQILHVNDCL